MNGVGMSDHHDLLLFLFLKGFDYEMLTEVGHIHTFHYINTREFTSSCN